LNLTERARRYLNYKGLLEVSYAKLDSIHEERNGRLSSFF
jgi:hypothetical protein